VSPLAVSLSFTLVCQAIDSDNRGVEIIPRVIGRLLVTAAAAATTTTTTTTTFFLFGATAPPVDHGFLIHEVSRSHNDAPQSVGLL
jgi:hypothetical protein